MRDLETILEFYTSRHKWIPEEILNSLGHFNVFNLEPPNIGKGAADLEYGRREWYNIVLVFGSGIFHCSGKSYVVKNHAIAFSNPYTPFGWEKRDRITKGYYCIFNEQFLRNEKRIVELPPFKTNTTPFFELNKQEAAAAEHFFKRMFTEMSSNYIYKYDLARILVEELMHLTLRSKQYKEDYPQVHNSSQRITIQFLDLLERQFPIESPHQTISLLTASDFADKLFIHVNHLNKSVKEITEKTTTQIIKERIAQEAQTLIRHTNWNFSEIAFALGFREATHFNNFFKKATGLSPSKYRNV